MVLSLAAFMLKPEFTDADFTLSRFDQESGTARGEIVTAQVAWPKWTATFDIWETEIGLANEIRAIIESLGTSGQFYAHNPGAPFPRLDPKGAGLSGASPAIQSIGADNKSLRVGGLPSGYRLSIGDMLSFDRGSNPPRRSLHRVTQAAQANSAGVTGFFTVAPHLRLGTVTGLSVTLARPSAKMQIVRDSPNYGRTTGVMVSGMSFSAIEAY